jgi:hypothetical protein
MDFWILTAVAISLAVFPGSAFGPTNGYESVKTPVSKTRVFPSSIIKVRSKLMPGSSRCRDCDWHGNGKCSKCYGTGINLKLNSGEAKCGNCGGTGSCPNCGGTGGRPFAMGPIQELIYRLFGH